MRVRIFVDYWNFQLTWNDRTQKAPCDWRRLPGELLRASTSVTESAELGALSLEETRVYAGYEAGREGKLKDWLHNWLDRQPGIRVFTSERHWREQPVHCRACREDFVSCPACGSAFGRAAEKTVDARIVTDLVGLAWEDAYDVAILVSGDKDFIPAVDFVQRKNYKVINACWRRRGNELAQLSWASLELDALLPRLIRGDRAP
ncbi:MAG: NYN domain-containing protein [Gemmatimonadales bacterium]|nr:NYN domain-containing protein [Gemmatimonadales bacterium]